MKFFLFALLCCLAAPFCIASTISPSSATSFSLVFSHETKDIDSLLPPSRDCAAVHARAWTLHVFCSTSHAADAAKSKLLQQERGVRVVDLPSDVHRLHADRATAEVLETDRQQQRLCAVATLAILPLRSSSNNWTEALLQKASSSSSSHTPISWTIHDASSSDYFQRSNSAVLAGCPAQNTATTTADVLEVLYTMSSSSSWTASLGAVVTSVHVVPAAAPVNWYSRGVLSTGGGPADDFFAAVGVLGAGAVVGVADTGIDTDHCFFDDPAHPTLQYNAFMPDHRKIARYQSLYDDAESRRDGFRGHGTHVAGTVAGSPLPSANAPADVARHHGFAPLARLSFLDMEGAQGMGSANAMSLVFDSARHDGAAVHSNSWGTRSFSAMGAYTGQCAQVDGYAWSFADFLPVFAAGNDADKRCVDDSTTPARVREGDLMCDHYSVIPPCTSKNVLCVGSSVAPLASWQEADLGNFVVQLHRGSSNGNGGGALIDTFNAVHAEFGMHHPHLAPTKLHLVVPREACAADGDFTEAEAALIKGAVAVAYRGKCHFTEKAERLQAAGAAMVLVINTEAGGAVEMGEQGAQTKAPLTLPAVMISKEAGERLAQHVSLLGVAELTLSLAETSKPLATKNRHDLSGWSARGPTHDLRYKPEIVAVGEFVHSAFSDHDLTTHNCNLWSSMGTSMSTPEISANAVLVREFFAKQLHVAPAARSSKINNKNSSSSNLGAAALKAVLILAAVPLTGVVNRNLHGDIRSLAGDPTPSFEQGHGILRTASVLPNWNSDRDHPLYSAAARQNGVHVIDSRSGGGGPLTRDAKGNSVSFCFEYSNATVLPFRAALAWVDPPASPTSGAHEKEPLLVNDLDLIVDDPLGRRHRGNKDGANPPEVGDDRNNVEKVTATAGTVGIFRVTVVAARIAPGYGEGQHFALAVSSGHLLASCPADHPAQCKTDADCGGGGGGKCSATVCSCAPGFRGARCQLAPHILPVNGVVGRIFPMQWQQFVVLVAPPASLSAPSSPARLQLRSLQRDGDPNVLARWAAPASRDADAEAGLLNECDDCAATPAEGPREAQIATVELPAKNASSALFLGVTAGCCWWAQYQLGLETVPAERQVAPTHVSAVHVEQDDALPRRFYEVLLQVQGADKPRAGQLQSRDGAVMKPTVKSTGAPHCSFALQQCALHFDAEAVDTLCSDGDDGLLSLTLSYEHFPAVRADFVQGADAVLNCTRLRALPLVKRSSANSAATTTRAPASSPSSSSSGPEPLATLVAELNPGCVSSARSDFSGLFSAPERPLLRPPTSCFLGTTSTAHGARWLMLPRSVADFPVRVGVRVNTTRLHAEHGIVSAEFVRVAFRSATTGVAHACRVADFYRELVVCDLGGPGDFIRSQTPLLLELSDAFSADRSPIAVGSVGVAVAPRPRSDGFVTSADALAGGDPVSTDISLPPWATKVFLAAVGYFFRPTVAADVFGENADASQVAAAVPAPQISLALGIARLFIVPVDDADEFTLGNFGSVACEHPQPQQQSADANITATRMACSVPRHSVPCGVPLSLHLNVARALFGSTAAPISDSVMFPAVECGLEVLGLEAPGRAVLAVVSSSAAAVIFNVVGQFGTIRNSAVSLQKVVSDSVSWQMSQESTTTTTKNNINCTVLSRSTTTLRVSCPLAKAAAAYRVAVHGRDTSGGPNTPLPLDFTVWKTTDSSRRPLTLLTLEQAPALAGNVSVASSCAGSPVSCNTLHFGGVPIFRRFFSAATSNNNNDKGDVSVVGKVDGRRLLLHVRLGRHHSCEIIEVGDAGNTVVCVASSVRVRFSDGSAGSTSSSSSSSALSSHLLAAPVLEMWMEQQQVPVLEFAAGDVLPSVSPSVDVDLAAAWVRFAARPSSALLAALSQHHPRPFEVAATLHSDQVPPRYFSLDDDALASSGAGSSPLTLTLFAVDGRAAKTNPCRGGEAKTLLQSTLSEEHAVRLRRALRKGRGRGNNNSSVVYPARFDGLDFPCDAKASWLHERAFFVAVCASVGRGAADIIPPPIQIAEMRPPRFVALHVTSLPGASRRNSAGSATSAPPAADGDQQRLAGHFPRQVIRLVLPGCDNSNSDSGNSDDGQETLRVERGTSLVLGVTVNVALYSDETRAVQRRGAPPLVTVERIFFARDADCSAEIESESRTASVSMNTDLTSLHVHDEHWWSRTTASYTFVSTTALDTAVFDAAFPATKSFVCAEWRGATDALIFTQQHATEQEQNEQQQSSSSSSWTRHIARIASVQHGGCVRDEDCGGSHSTCEAQVCRCASERRGAWCERRCPMGAGSSAHSQVCSGRGACNAAGTCECDGYYFGAACDEELHTPRFVALSDAERAAGQARAKYSGRVVGAAAADGAVRLLHVRIPDTAPPGKQIRVVVGGIPQPGDTGVFTPRTPSVLFWRSARLKNVTTGQVPVLAVGEQDSSKSSVFVARSPVFAPALFTEVAVPYRSLTISIPPAVAARVVAAKDQPRSTAQHAVDIDIFVDADAPHVGGCESWVCAVIAIVAGIVGAATGFTAVHCAMDRIKKKNQAEKAAAMAQHDHVVPEQK